MLEDAGLAVDVGDLAPAAGGVRVRRVVGHEAEVVLVDLDLPEVHRLHRAVGDLELVGLAGPVVGHRQRVLRGGYAAAVLALRLLLGHRASLLWNGSTRKVTARRVWRGAFSAGGA